MKFAAFKANKLLLQTISAIFHKTTNLKRQLSACFTRYGCAALPCAFADMRLVYRLYLRLTRIQKAGTRRQIRRLLRFIGTQPDGVIILKASTMQKQSMAMSKAKEQ